MSELITNLQTIYNTKLAIKAAIGTDSDEFAQYPAYIAAMSGGGITPSGTSYITTNGEHDVTSYAYAYVSVEGGESGGGDPYNDSYGINYVVNNDLVGETVEYYMSALSDNYEATLTSEPGASQEEYTIEWDENANIDGNDVTVHVIANTGYDPLENIEDNYSDNLEALYDDIIYPILENAIVTESEDPSNDGYDYLVEGDLKYFNLQELGDAVEEITENGFYPVVGNAVFSVDIPIPDDYIVEANNIELFTGYENYIDTGDALPVLLECDVLSDYEYSSGEAVFVTQLSFDGTTYTAQVTVSSLYGDPYSSLYDENDELYSDLYGYLRMVVGNAVIEEDRSDNYDYTITADYIMYNNLQTNVNEFAEINSNGYYNTVPYAYTYINVSGGGGGITPSGTSYITTNGSHDVTSYATAYVNVSSSVTFGESIYVDKMFDSFDTRSYINLQNYLLTNGELPLEYAVKVHPEVDFDSGQNYSELHIYEYAGMEGSEINPTYVWTCNGAIGVGFENNTNSYMTVKCKIQDYEWSPDPEGIDPTAGHYDLVDEYSAEVGANLGSIIGDFEPGYHQIWLVSYNFSSAHVDNKDMSDEFTVDPEDSGISL